MKKLLLPFAILLAAAPAAFGATASWNGYHISTVQPVKIGAVVKNQATGMYGPNPLQANRTLEHRVLRNAGGVVTSSPVISIPASPGSGLPTSPPGTGSVANAFGSCTAGASYVSSVRVVNTLGGGSAWANGPGVVLC